MPMFSPKPLEIVSRSTVCMYEVVVSGRGGGRERGLPIRIRKILIKPRHGDAACSISYEEGFLHIDRFGGEIVVLQYLIPHPRPRLAVVIERRRGIDGSWDIQSSQDRRGFALPGFQTASVCCRGFAVGVQLDGSLVAD